MREILRVVLFLLLLALYISSLTGAILGMIHLILIFLNPKKFGMSRILNEILKVERRAVIIDSQRNSD